LAFDERPSLKRPAQRLGVKGTGLSFAYRLKITSFDGRVRVTD
jgi:hypothetical protein